MKTITYCICLLSFLSSCTTQNTANSANEALDSNGIEIDQNALIIGDPLDCGIENTLLFPVGGSYQPEAYRGDQIELRSLSFTSNQSSKLYDRWASSEFINSDRNAFDITNILFYDPRNRESYALTTDSIHILSFALHQEFDNPLIFYRVVKANTNGDEIVDEADGVALYTSTLNGHDFRQVTPDNESFTDYFYYSATQSILAKTIVDRNKDGVFSSADETNFREVLLSAPAMVVEIFDTDLKNSIRIDH